MAQLAENQNTYGDSEIDEIFDEEKRYANELALEQEREFAYQQAQRLYDEGTSFGRPSGPKWGFVGFLAVINDVVDILAFTGVGEIVAWTISIILTAVILLIVFLSTGKVRRAHDYVGNLNQSVDQIRAIAQRVEGLGQKTAGTIRKIPGLKNVGIRTAARKNPLFRVAIGSGLESVPFLGALNLITVWVYFAYAAEKEAFENARQAAEEAVEGVKEGFVTA